jgi:hypothetical protein
MRRESANFRRSSAQLQNGSEADSHLDQVAQLLALGIRRLAARRASAHPRDNSAGLCDAKERVLAPEHHP